MIVNIVNESETIPGRAMQKWKTQRDISIMSVGFGLSSSKKYQLISCRGFLALQLRCFGMTFSMKLFRMPSKYEFFFFCSGMYGLFRVQLSSPAQSNLLKNLCCFRCKKLELFILSEGYLDRSCISNAPAGELNKCAGISTVLNIISSEISIGSSVMSPKGSFPVRNSQNITPMDQRSASYEQAFPVNTSGAIQAGVPIIVWVLKLSNLDSFLAAPKSTSLIQPSCLTITFSGLKSLQIMQWPCRYSAQRRREHRQNCATVISSILDSLSTSYSSKPSIYSMIRQTVCLSLSEPWYLTMKGESTWLRQVCSLWMLGANCRALIKDLLIHLTTSIESLALTDLLFLAKNTSEKDPSAIFLMR